MIWCWCYSCSEFSASFFWPHFLVAWWKSCEKSYDKSVKDAVWWGCNQFCTQKLQPWILRSVWIEFLDDRSGDEKTDSCDIFITEDRLAEIRGSLTFDSVLGANVKHATVLVWIRCFGNPIAGKRNPPFAKEVQWSFSGDIWLWTDHST